MEGSGILVLDGQRTPENADFADPVSGGADFSDLFPCSARILEDVGGDGVSAPGSDDEFHRPVPREVMDADEFLAASDRKGGTVDGNLGTGDGASEGLAPAGEIQRAGRTEEITVQSDDESLRIHIAVGTHLGCGTDGEKTK